MSENELDIEKRVNISVAVGRYLRSVERFNEASKEFTGSCKALRQQLGKERRLIVQVDFQHYLVTSDRDGNLEAEQIDCI